MLIKKRSLKDLMRLRLCLKNNTSSKKYFKPTSIEWVFYLENFLKAKRINTLKLNLSTSYLHC